MVQIETDNIHKEIKQLRKTIDRFETYIRSILAPDEEPVTLTRLRAQKKSKPQTRYEAILAYLGDEWVTQEQIMEGAPLSGGYEVNRLTLREMARNKVISKRTDRTDFRRNLYRRLDTTP